MTQITSKIPRVSGTFQINVLDGTPEQHDPWRNGYTAAPKFTKTERTYALRDFRDEAFDKDNQFSYARSAELLTKYGFTAVKFDPARLINGDEDSVKAEDFDDMELLEEIYYPEVRESILNLTGAKKVLITNSIVRRGDGSTSGGKHGDLAVNGPPTPPKSPTHRPNEYKAVSDTQPTHLGSSDNAKPSRTPHMDYTALGARRSIRSWRPDIYEAARDAGVLEAEDQICRDSNVDPQEPESDEAIRTQYNAGETIGPRYAAYSVWRPLRTVTRDPLAMSPRSSFKDSKDLVFRPYYQKVLASPAMKGDFLRELEALGMSVEAANAQSPEVQPEYEGPHWYYLSEQKADEVIILKFFDSASLGVEGEAPSVPHASPDIGDSAYGAARESIEVRCIVFW